MKELHRHDLSSTGSCILFLARMSSTLLPHHLLHLPPSSARVLDCTIRSSPPLSVAGFALNAGSSAFKLQRHSFWYLVMLLLYFVCFESCWTMDPFGELCSVRDAGNGRLSMTSWPIFNDPPTALRGTSRNSRQYLMLTVYQQIQYY